MKITTKVRCNAQIRMYLMYDGIIGMLSLLYLWYDATGEAAND